MKRARSETKHIDGSINNIEHDPGQEDQVLLSTIPPDNVIPLCCAINVGKGRKFNAVSSVRSGTGRSTGSYPDM